MRKKERDFIFEELGTTGLTRFGTNVSEEWLKDLQGSKGIRIYKEMRDNDSIVGAFLFAIKMLIRQVSWRVDSASDTPEDKEAADFLESCMYDMSVSWNDFISEILSMLVFGWAWFEIVYKRRLGKETDPSSKYNDGRIGWRKISLRAQETLLGWEFDENGGIKAMIQMAPPDYQIRTIPIEKSLLFRTETSKGNPEGRSILRNAYRSWYFKKNIEEIEGIGIERDLAGLPVALVPPELLSPNATSEQRATLESIRDLVTKLRRDEMEGVVFPAEEYADGRKTGYKLTLLSSGSKRNFDTNSVIARYDQRIAMTVLADFILLGHEKVGSFALSSDKTSLFAVAIGAVLDHIEEVLNTYAVPRLFQLNAFPNITDYPRFAHGDIEKPDLDVLGRFISSLSQSGLSLFPDEGLENYLRSLVNFPEKIASGSNVPTPDTNTSDIPEDVQDLIKFLEVVRKRLEEEENE